MKRLFIKMFLWFWLAMALVWSAFTLPGLLTRDPSVALRYRELHDQRLQLSGRVALVVARNSTQAELLDWMAGYEEGEALYPYVLDGNLEDIAGRELPEESREAAGRTFTEGSVWLRLEGRGLWAGRQIESRNGARYAVVQRLPSVLDLPAPPVWPIALRWLAVLATSGLVCYAMARYLLAPVGTLRDATHRFSEGDLEARVGDQLAGRDDELGQLGRDFDHMAGRLGTLLSAQRQLLRDISHELRSPLARLSVALGLARRRSQGDSTEALDRIEREADRLNELIGQLLSLTRMEGDGTAAEPERIELLPLVRDIVDDADFEAQGRGRHVELVEGETCVTDGHPELLHRAIENVVRNAVRYTGEGTTVRASLTSHGTNGTHEAVFVVRDDGPGVPDETLTNLFEPFYRTDEARERASGGTGLGLSISDRAVRLHGGSIVARNVEDGGLEVEIRLPARDNRPADREATV